MTLDSCTGHSGLLGRHDNARRLDAFERAWQTGQLPRLDDFVSPPADLRRRGLLMELIKIDLEYRWRAGTGQIRRARLEDYLTRYPELGPTTKLPLDLIAWEYRVRRKWGDRPACAQYLQRFPVWATALSTALTAVDAELAAEAAAPEGRLLPDLSTAELAESSRAAAGGMVAVRSAVDLVRTLRQLELLDAAQLEQIDRRLCQRFPQSRMLAHELLRRGWLTPYQVNQLLQGSGARLVLGPYVLVERLGEGATGQVFKALNRRVKRQVALKVIRKELLADTEVVGRFYREIQVVSRLDHPNIVRAWDAGPMGHNHVLSLEYIEGTDLARLVKQAGPLPVAQACEFIRQAALGLQHAHEKGLVHRDVKPSNLILQAEDQVIKILDLGLARLAEGPEAMPMGGDSARLTPLRRMLIMGTPDYMAPEQALNFHLADSRADIYSLGCTLFFLLTAAPPFSGGSMADKLWRHQQAELPPARAAGRRLNAVLRRMLAKRPEHRYQTAAEIAETLAAFAAGGHAGWNALLPRSVLGNLSLSRRAVLAVGAGGICLAAGVAAAQFLGKPLTAMSPPESAAGETNVWRHQGPVRHVAFSPDGEVVVSGGDDRVVHLWDVGTGKERGVFRELAGPVWSVAMLPDGKPVALEARGRRFKLWDVASGRERPGPPCPDLGDAGFAAVALAPDGRTWASLENNQDLRLWNTTMRPQGRLGPGQRGRLRFVSSVAFSPDGKSLALGCRDGTVGLWRHGPTTNARDRMRAFGKHPGPVVFLVFSPNGAVLASGGKDGSVRLWESATGQERALPEPEPGLVYHSAAFSADGKTLALGASDHVVRLWDVAGGRVRAKLTGHAGPVLSVAFARDGKTLASGSADQTVRLWPISAER